MQILFHYFVKNRLSLKRIVKKRDFSNRIVKKRDLQEKIVKNSDFRQIITRKNNSEQMITENTTFVQKVTENATFSQIATDNKNFHEKDRNCLSKDRRQICKFYQMISKNGTFFEKLKKSEFQQKITKVSEFCQTKTQKIQIQESIAKITRISSKVRWENSNFVKVS